ncbi:uncharacterized protein A1O9_11274 [Exophiala aquamarina CBS 119918]|uniref:Uncharacterized protein n=1 Tax=Exophiala aquamarina CBS 119918 TaxID=1182545 RepID=A0A072NZL3_9EURO|nr:uncharacterized protein A1O9_11274 [Exophiala aquamarina CBS 119918]KEF52857.1 hypothetical protein A1O9_11274 [Exophiala aquamarina CBS 119918]
MAENVKPLQIATTSQSSDDSILPSKQLTQTLNDSASAGSPITSIDKEQETPQMPVERKQIPLRDCKISFAMDTSGSTLGEVLRSEREGVQEIWSLLNPVISVSHINSLHSYGGTDPSVLLDHKPGLIELKNSDLWFLFTDGEIPNERLEIFADEVSYHELHGTACVVVVVGTRQGLPSYCNDVNSGKLHILQCKGRFIEILERARLQQPVLDDKASWEDLPQMTWRDLICVSFIPSQKLKRDEIMLEADLVVNLDDLFSDRLKGRSIIDRILQSREQVRTNSLTARSRDQGEILRNWAIRQELDPEDFSLIERPAVGDRARQSITTIFNTMQASPGLSGEAFAKLRAANSRNSEAFESAKKDQALLITVAIEFGTVAPTGDTIICALPLVSYSKNKDAYIAQLDKAFQNRFESNDTALVFVAVLFTTASRKSISNNPNGQQLLGALKWARRDLAQSVTCVTTLSPALATDGCVEVRSKLCDSLMQASKDALRSDTGCYYQYPIEGFVVMTRIMDGLQQTKPQVRLTIKKTVFQRFLFHITEQFHNHLATEGPIITHLLMSQLTILGDMKRDGSPRPVAEKKTSFRTLAGLTKNLFGDRKSLTRRQSLKPLSSVNIDG